MRVLERFTERLIERQRAMYAADVPVHREVADGDALPRRGLATGTRRSGSSCRRWRGTGRRSASASPSATREWRAVLREAFAPARREYGLDMPSTRSSRSWDVQRGNHARAALRHRDRASRATRVDRRMARKGGAMTTTVDLVDRHRARADACALPRRGGLRRARRRADLLRGVRRRASRRCCSCRRGRSSTRATGRCRSPTSRGTAACSRSTARQRPLGSPSRARRLP